jgi:N-methylhydantoinase A
VYGYARERQPVEFINFRAVHRYPLPPPVVRASARHRGAVGDARLEERPAYFAPAGFMATAVYERARLPLEARVPGPAIIEQPDTTTVVPPGYVMVVDDSGNLHIRREP